LKICVHGKFFHEKDNDTNDYLFYPMNLKSISIAVIISQTLAPIVYQTLFRYQYSRFTSKKASTTFEVKVTRSVAATNYSESQSHKLPTLGLMSIDVCRFFLEPKGSRIFWIPGVRLFLSGLFAKGYPSIP
jgi:hypothetical protein